VVLGGYGWLLWAAQPFPVLVLTAILALVVLIENLRYRRHLRRVVEARAGESLCTYARTLPIRDLDTWVVRAVFEQLQAHIGDRQGPIPLRPSDRLREDLKIDPDDLDPDLANEIAERSGRTLSQTDANPYYGRVVTVEDLIRFFCAQPRKAT
jgi:hypothetical protein